MNRWTILIVFLFILVAILWLLLSGSSRSTYWPGLDDVVLDPQNPTEVLIPIEGWRLEGLEQVELILPFSINRRPIRIHINIDGGEKLAELDVDPETALRTFRTFTLQKPPPSGAGQRFDVRLLFEDGPVLKEGMDKKQTLKGLGLTMIYPLDVSQALLNYSRFKPVPWPALCTAVLFVLYALVAAYLWGLFAGGPACPAQASPGNKKPERGGPP